MAGYKKTSKTAPKTATSRAIHGTGNGPINGDDSALQLEALRIASVHLDESAAQMEVVFPLSPMVERLRVFADNMRDLASRMVD